MIVVLGSPVFGVPLDSERRGRSNGPASLADLRGGEASSIRIPMSSGRGFRRRTRDVR